MKIFNFTNLSSILHSNGRNSSKSLWLILQKITFIFTLSRNKRNYPITIFLFALFSTIFFPSIDWIELFWREIQSKYTSRLVELVFYFFLSLAVCLWLLFNLHFSLLSFFFSFFYTFIPFKFFPTHNFFYTYMYRLYLLLYYI